MTSSSSNIHGRRLYASRFLPVALAVVGAGGAAASERAALREGRDCPRVALALVCGGHSQPGPGVDPQRNPRGDDGGASRGDGREERGDRGRDGREGRGDRRTYGGPFDMSWGYYGKGGHGDMRPPKAQEWLDVQLFMNRYSPRRQYALDQLPDGEKKESIRRFVFARYRSLQDLQRRDRTGYDQRLEQLTIEDEIYGIVSAWGAASADEQKQLRQGLHDKVARLVDIDLRERQRRVEWLKRELEEQSRELERDQADRDALVERRASRFEDWAARSAAQRDKQDVQGKDSHGDGSPKAEDRPKTDGPAGDPAAPSEKKAD